MSGNGFEVLDNVHAYSDAVRARRFTQQPQSAEFAIFAH
jgi:hypothetical protein